MLGRGIIMAGLVCVMQPRCSDHIGNRTGIQPDYFACLLKGDKLVTARRRHDMLPLTQQTKIYLKWEE